MAFQALAYIPFGRIQDWIMAVQAYVSCGRNTSNTCFKKPSQPFKHYLKRCCENSSSQLSENTYFYIQCAPISEKVLLFWKVTSLRPFVSLVRATCRWKWVWKFVEWHWQGIPRYAEINLSQSHFVHHKSLVDWPGIEAALPHWLCKINLKGIQICSSHVPVYTDCLGYIPVC